MPRLFLTALAVVLLSVGSGHADDNHKKAKATGQPTNVTITKVNADKGEITVSYTDEKGKSREKLFELAGDVKLLDETGRVVTIAVFESGSDALMIESEGKIRELRRMPKRSRVRDLSDAVRTRIEMADVTEDNIDDLQKIYDMLRNLDTGKDGKLDPKAIKAEANRLLEERVKDVFTRLDTNKDGKISPEEARGLIKEHFDHIDANKDGFITLDELMKAAKDRHEEKGKSAQTSDRTPTEQEKK
jgi:Ca2+-binding EF-hand superfamily protein